MLRIVVYVVSVAVFLAVAQLLVDAPWRNSGLRERAGWGWVSLVLSPLILFAWYVATERQAVAMGYPDYETAPDSWTRGVDLASGAVVNGPLLIGILLGALAWPVLRGLSPALAVLANAAVLWWLLDMSENDPHKAWVWWVEGLITVLVFAAVFFGGRHWIRSRQDTRLHRERAMAE
jgi:hypothetical protein